MAASVKVWKKGSPENNYCTYLKLKRIERQQTDK